jgi:hypothetical protein
MAAIQHAKPGMRVSQDIEGRSPDHQCAKRSESTIDSISRFVGQLLIHMLTVVNFIDELLMRVSWIDIDLRPYFPSHQSINPRLSSRFNRQGVCFETTAIQHAKPGMRFSQDIEEHSPDHDQCAKLQVFDK